MSLDNVKKILIEIKELGKFKPQSVSLFEEYNKVKKEAIDNFRKRFKSFISEKEVYQHLISYKVYEYSDYEDNKSRTERTIALTKPYYDYQEALTKLEEIVNQYSEEEKYKFKKESERKYIYYERKEQTMGFREYSYFIELCVSKSSELLVKLKEYHLKVNEDNFVFHEPIERYLLSYYYDSIGHVVDKKITTEQFKELAKKATIKTKKEYIPISDEEYKIALENAKYNVRYI
jgi:hypothetical protein